MSDNIGSAGRVRRAARLPEPPVMADSETNSWCVYCAAWHFGQRLVKCSKCGGAIFRWYPTEDLRLFRSRGALCNL